MRIAPLFPAAPHGLGVQRISANLVPMVLPETLPLAGDLAANGLLRVIAGGLEGLLAVTAKAIAHHGGSPDQNRIRSFCPAGRLNLSAPQKSNRL